MNCIKVTKTNVSKSKYGQNYKYAEAWPCVFAIKLINGIFLGGKILTCK